MKKFMSVLLTVMMIFGTVSCITLSAVAEEAQEPIKVYTKEDLDNIKNNMSGSYILMNDIVFDEADYVKGGDFYNSGMGWFPIGTLSTPFKGKFDGNNHAIKNLYINNPNGDDQGLFGYGEKIEIKNLRMENVNITGKNNIGAVIGRMGGYSIISNCIVKGSVKGTDTVGGLCGKASLNDNNAGFFKSTNYSTVIGQTNVGGICGCGESSNYSFPKINSCRNLGNITAQKSCAAGIIAYTRGESKYHSNSSGYCWHTYYYFIIISCYNTGNINAADSCGGIVGTIGSNGCTVKHCYTVGKITADKNYSAIVANPDKETDITFCYYLDESIENPTTVTGIAKSEDQLRKQSTFEQWNFTNTWTISKNKEYKYPELKALAFNATLELSGETEVGSDVTATLNVNNADGIDTANVSFKWYLDDQEVEGKPTEEWNKSIYTVKNEDKDKKLYCKVSVPTDNGDEVIISDKLTVTWKHDHSYTKTVTPPTCTEDGYTTYTCLCGTSYKADYVAALGHDFGEWKQTTAPTCQQEGELTRSCSHCTATESSKIEKIDHQYIKTVTPATCTEDGYTTYTCHMCNDSYKAEVTKATGHKDGEWKVTKPASYTEEGEKSLFCEKCGEVIKTEKIAKLTGKINSVKVDNISMNYKESKTLNPDITVDGNVKYTVSYSSSNNKVAKVDSNGKVTASGKGSAKITCTVTDEYGYSVSAVSNVTVNYNFGQWLIVILLFGWIWY